MEGISALNKDENTGPNLPQAEIHGLKAAGSSPRGRGCAGGVMGAEAAGRRKWEKEFKMEQPQAWDEPGMADKHWGVLGEKLLLLLLY